MKHQFLFIMLMVILSITSTVGAQDCPAIIMTAMQRTAESCAGMGRDQACYGSRAIDARLSPGISPFAFNGVGDMTRVDSIEALSLHGLNFESGEWGVALLRVQADIPLSANPENVTLLLFGETSIEQTTGAEFQPMQAFYLQTGDSADGCGEIPSSGLLIQTPEGVGKVSLWINEVKIRVGSTVLFQAQPGGEMSIATLEGLAEVTANGETQEAAAGMQVRVPMSDDLRPTGAPTAPEPVTLDALGESALVELANAATTGDINRFYGGDDPTTPESPGDAAAPGEGGNGPNGGPNAPGGNSGGCNNENGQGDDNGNCFGQDKDKPNNGNNGGGNNGGGNNGGGNNGKP